MATGFGAFGKIPALGDFFRLNLPQGFVEPWDVWLQSAMVTARTALGTRWNDCFLTAPLWRFSLAPGLAGPQAVTGVMMASVDRVGRQFPLTLAAPHPAGASAERVHLAASSVFEDLEAIALDMLEDGMTKELLAERLAAQTLPGLPAPAPHPEGAARVVIAPDHCALLAELAGDHVSHSYRRPSLWSTALGDGRRLLVCEGLPDGALVPALFEITSPVWSEDVDYV
jgi:type VI secretion system protein ImpM